MWWAIMLVCFTLLCISMIISFKLVKTTWKYSLNAHYASNSWDRLVLVRTACELDLVQLFIQIMQLVQLRATMKMQMKPGTIPATTIKLARFAYLSWRSCVSFTTIDNEKFSIWEKEKKSKFSASVLDFCLQIYSIWCGGILTSLK